MARDYLQTVKYLLAQAESLPENSPERVAFEIKAFEIMTKEGIDQAMVAFSPDRVADTVVNFIKTFDAPYAISKADLYAAIAVSFRCEVIKKPGKDKNYHIFGFQSDIDKVEELYTILLLYGNSQIINARIPAGTHLKSFTTSWWVGFSYQIGQRLREAEKNAVKEATIEHGAGTAIVLADRKRLVNRSMRQEYQHLTFTKKQFSSSAGLRAGVDAAKGANLGGSSVSGLTRRAIS